MKGYIHTTTNLFGKLTQLTIINKNINDNAINVELHTVEKIVIESEVWDNVYK